MVQERAYDPCLDVDNIWDLEEHFTKEQLAEYFCKRIKPKLSELDYFKDQDLSSFEAQKKAVIKVLKWSDDGTECVSKEFREFYDGLLCYSNVQFLNDGGMEFEQFRNILFEIHGSDPQNLPEAMKIGLRLLSDVLNRGTLESWRGWTLQTALRGGTARGSQAAITLRLYLEYYKREWGKKWGFCAPCDPFSLFESGKLLTQFPLYAGFLVCCDAALNSCCEDIKALLKRDEEVNSEPLGADSETGGHIQVLVGPSGCGKTSKIHSLLKKHWGLYLLPGNLPKTSDEVELRDRLEYKPRRGGGSRDTQTWLDDAKSISQYGPASHLLKIRAYQILYARIWILEQFRATGPNRTPGDWLKLQTGCRELQNDIFNRLYRVARFTRDSLEVKADEVRRSKLIFCFDEAQCDLEASLPAGDIMWPMTGQEPQISSQPLNHMIMAAFIVKQSFNDPKNLELCISGTALQLRGMQQIIEFETSRLMMQNLYCLATNSLTRDNLFSSSDCVPKINRDFRLVETEETFRDLIRAGKYRYGDDDLVSVIIKHSKPLRGRIVWSVCYLDEIHNLIHKRGGDHTKLQDKHVKEASVRVCEMAKQGLMERLKDMRRHREAPCGSYEGNRPQHREVMDELCSLAIRSDLLGEATIFKSPESADLVALGFAFLEEAQGSDVSQVLLKERLAVDAAIEYFQRQKLSNGQSEYDHALINFLYSEQSNASALGKVAELFFAWHLRKVLGTRTDIILPTFGDDYRTQVVQILMGNAQTIEQIESGKKVSDVQSRFAHHAKCDDLNEFRLVEGKRTAYQEDAGKTRAINVWDWLRDIRTGNQEDDLQSTFWFPSNNTGPDVLFALRRKTPKATTSLPHHYRTRQRAGEKRKRNLGNEIELDFSLVLCAVQIKREKRISDVGRAIATTDPNYWFSNNYPHHTRDALEITKELREWQKGKYPIVRILVSALADPSQYRKAEEGSTTAEKYFRNKAVKTNQKSSEDTLVEEGRRDDLQKVRIPPHQQYFTSIGAEHDDLLFGDAFRRLRKAQGIQTTWERRGKA